MKTTRKAAFSWLLRPRTAALGSRGNMAIEFALVAPLMLFLLTMVVDIGLALNELKRLELAAETGMGYARYSPSDVEGIQAAALSATQGKGQRISIAVDKFCACITGDALACTDTCTGEKFPASYVRVTASSDFDGLFGLIPVTEAISMRSDAVGRVQ